jgi:hypothetical protein
MPQTGAAAAKYLDIDVCGERTGTGQGFDLPRRCAAVPQSSRPSTELPTPCSNTRALLLHRRNRNCLSPLIYARSGQLAGLALKHRWDATSIAHAFAEADGAIAYGPKQIFPWKRAVRCCDRAPERSQAGRASSKPEPYDRSTPIEAMADDTPF